MSTALATFGPFTPLYPCPPWCDPRACDRRHEVEDDGRITEVASHSGPVTVIGDANAEYDSLHVSVRQLDLNADADPPEITIGLNAAFLGDPRCGGIASLTPAKAREFAAVLLAQADLAEGVTR